MMFRLQNTPGDLFLSHDHKINPDIMITMHKGGMKNSRMNSCQVVVLNKGSEQGFIGLNGLGIFNIPPKFHAC